MRKRLSWGLTITIVLVALAVFVPNYLDASAKRSAESFCDSVVVGEAVTTMEKRAERDNAKLGTWQPIKGITHHQGWFSGFLGNASSCEIFSQDGFVISKYAEDQRW
jgi:hypothetical protein